MQDADGDFLWHQPSNGSWTDERLIEAQFYVIPVAELESVNDGVVWLHTPTGKLVQPPSDARKSEYLKLLAPTVETRERGRRVLSIRGNCPACGQRTRPDAPVAMDLATKGEAPFAHLVRSQVEAQPLSKPRTPQAPNGGRKTIIFSDGRQKAARLARDIPREIELDVFRQALFIAAQLLLDLKREPRLNEQLYVAFLKALLVHDLRFFDGDDRNTIDSDLASFVRFFDGDLEEQLKDGGPKPPPRYWEILLKQLGTPFYSVSALTLGYVVPTAKPIFARIRAELATVPEAEIEGIVVAWIQRMLTRFAFGKEIAEGVRNQASKYPLKPSAAIDGFSPKQREFLSTKGIDVPSLAECLATNLCEAKSDGSLYLKPSHLALRPALDVKWVQCSRCKTISPLLMFGHCPNCLSPDATMVPPDATTYLRARKGFWRDPVAKAMAGTLSPMNVDVQEHSAQLSHKDATSPSPTTEIYERQFRDILKPGERAVDVLSCTTTMEVGIDIGSLIAVSMRNVPPMRQNYQQRAGRAGRRGSAVSTVVTYAQSGAHDSFYFLNPHKILAGDPPKPVLDTTNSRIANRHVLAQLLQDFFRPLAGGKGNGDIYTALGDTWAFFNSEGKASLGAFKTWVTESSEGRSSVERAQEWLPAGSSAPTVAEMMIRELEAVSPMSSDGVESSFIEFLFSKGLLPSYAFPTDLCSLQIQERIPGGGIRIVEQAQQGLNIALSEYAPGRLVVVNKKTYRIGTVTASGPDTEVDRAKALFDQSKVYRNCTQCSYTAGFISGDDGRVECPQCGAASLRTMTVIRPETVFPSNRREIDEFEDQVFSRVTQAQLPLADEERRLVVTPYGARGGLAFREKRRLVVVNEGDPNSDVDGFNVCSKCGRVLAEGEAEENHYRDYYFRASGAQISPKCDGEFRQVFLGYGFTSDVLLLRMDLRAPLRFGVLSRRNRQPIEDALQTLCEALTLSIGRVLDIDAREVSAGFRFGNDGASDFADIFIYDTLAGGAGYALQAGNSFAKVFDAATTLMSSCVCASSCENCLRHYGNRFSHTVLDRHLGIALADYIQNGNVPAPFSSAEQVSVLTPLIDMIRLAGWGVAIQGSAVATSRAGKDFLIQASPSLRACEARSTANGITTFCFTPFELARDLPSAFAELK